MNSNKASKRNYSPADYVPLDAPLEWNAPPAWRQQLNGLVTNDYVDDVVQVARQIVNSEWWPAYSGRSQLNIAARLQLLVELGATDLALARVLEAHIDAGSILCEAQLLPQHETGGDKALYGVWAACHRTTPLVATPEASGWRLSGTLPFCSGARFVDRALIVAHVGTEQLLLEVNANELPTIDDSTWYCAGMARIPAATLCFDGHFVAKNRLIGPAGFYLTRRGFWAGAVCVAACWLGGAIGILRRWHAIARGYPNTAHALTHFGVCVAAIDAAMAQLRQAGERIDDARFNTAALHSVALSARHTVEQTCEDLARRLGRALGPGPLIANGPLAQQLADLAIYVRQCHAERDLEVLGANLLNDNDQLTRGIPYPWL